MDFEDDLTELYLVIENMEQSLKDKIPNFVKCAIKRNVNINSLRYILEYFEEEKVIKKLNRKKNKSCSQNDS